MQDLGPRDEGEMRLPLLDAINAAFSSTRTEFAGPVEEGGGVARHQIVDPEVAGHRRSAEDSGNHRIFYAKMVSFFATIDPENRQHDFMTHLEVADPVRPRDKLGENGYEVYARPRQRIDQKKDQVS